MDVSGAHSKTNQSTATEQIKKFYYKFIFTIYLHIYSK
jgi:hypothetical protein